MTDIVERLRVCAIAPGDTHTVVICRLTRDTARDAADEIERLHGEVHRLREALLMWLDADDAGDGQECINAIAHARSVVGEGTP